jgi:hypothetical protein
MMTHMARPTTYIPTDQRVILLLRVAVALAAYHQHETIEADDYAQAARMLAKTRQLAAVDVDCMIA